MPFTDVFGGSTLQAAQVAYRAVALSANVTLVWPLYSTSATDYVARIMDVTPSAGGLVITMPDATLAGPGQDVIYRNLGASSFTVNDASGGALSTIAAGAVRYFYLQANANAAGTWASILLGVGSSNLDASQLAGYGLKATVNTLSFAPLVSTFSASQAITTSARSNVYVWTGGSGTLTLPTLAAASGMPDWEVEVRNQGSGTLTIAPVGGELIDAAASIALNVTESCFVHSGPTAWYTVGRGRNTQFNFTKLTKSITGGAVTLSLTEAANVIQVYSGVLASNETVTLPAVVQVYYIQNTTTGAHTLTFKSPVVGGTTVVVDQNASAVLFCDGTNIINCNTSGVTVNTVSLAAGSVGSPSLSFAGDSTTGVYQPTSGQFAITLSGTQKLLLTSTGLNSTAIGATTTSTGAFTTLAASGAATLTSTLAVTGAITATGGVVGAVTGNASTATALATARAINGVNFDGTAAITVTAAAGTLSGTTLNATVVTSSLTSVGTIATGVWNGSIITSAYGGTGNGFTKFTGPTTAEKTFTLPDASATLATTANNLSVFAATTSAQLAGVLSDETGTGAAVFATSPTLVTPLLGTPTSGTLTNCTGYTVANLSGAAAGVLTFLATPSSANLASAVTDETGTGALVFANTPTLVTPVLGVASATTINKVTLTTPATGSTLTIADGKTLTASNSITIAGTDGKTATFSNSIAFAGTDATTMTFPPASASIGYLNVPQNSQSAAYTTVLADAGKHILHPSADANARTFTIDSNANVAYPVGTTITFVNETSQNVTIAITSDTLTLAGTTSTGSRTLSQNGMATALKKTATSWLISGSGLS